MYVCTKKENDFIMEINEDMPTSLKEAYICILMGRKYIYPLQKRAKPEATTEAERSST